MVNGIKCTLTLRVTTDTIFVNGNFNRVKNVVLSSMSIPIYNIYIQYIHCVQCRFLRLGSGGGY